MKEKLRKARVSLKEPPREVGAPQRTVTVEKPLPVLGWKGQ